MNSRYHLRVLNRLFFLPPPEFTPGDVAAFMAAREICRRHARSFYFASNFLPPRKRYAAYAIYAFCRLLDDAVDQDQELQVADASDSSQSGRLARLEAVLQSFRSMLDQAYSQSLRLPDWAERSEAQSAMRAFELTIHRFGIRKQLFLDLADGCRMDLTITRYATWEELQIYCYRVAGVVGLIMCPIFGLSDPSAEREAIAMGNAMQLTNILRDIGEDWDRGRLYLPLEDLERFGFTPADVAARAVDERFTRLMRFEVDRARSLYRAGSVGLCALANDGSRFTASAMAVIYAGILNAIERQDYDVYRARAHLTTGQKLARLPLAWRLTTESSAFDVGAQSVPEVFPAR